MKIERSGSISQRHVSADPDLDPHQNVMDPQHCLQHIDTVPHIYFLKETRSSLGTVQYTFQNVVVQGYYFLQ
jgi:hypothetical protein